MVILVVVFCILIKHLGSAKAFTIFFFYSLFDKGLSLTGPLQVKDLILFLFLIILTNKIVKIKKQYPFYICTLISVASYFLTAFMVTEPHWPFTILKCVRCFIMPICFYYFVIRENTFLYFVKYLLYFSFFIIIYSLIELYLGTSPIVNFINDNNGGGMVMDEVFRYGVKRIQAVFIHSTALGYYCATVVAILLFFVNEQVRSLSKVSNLCYWFVIIGLTIISFLTGTRSAIIPVVFVFLWYSKNKILNINYLIFYIVTLIALFFVAQLYLSDYLNNVLESILNTNDNAVGSSTDMRQVQFELAFFYLMKSPIWGNGPSYTFDEVTPNNPEMYGAESVWMPLMIDNGIVGCIAYLSCYIYCIKYIMQSDNKIDSLFLLGLLLFINTATSVPGFDVSYIFILILCCVALQKYKIKRC